MTAFDRMKLIGDPVNRVDGPLKVSGTARYPSDAAFPGMVHAALVQSTIPAGTIKRIDAEAARATPGVLAVIAHDNAPRLADPPNTGMGEPVPRFPLKDDQVLHHGQHVAIVVAETREQAFAAARQVNVQYEAGAATLGIESAEAAVLRNPLGLEMQRGDVAAALATAEVVYDETFTIPAETNNPMGLFATVASWEGDRLVVHDATQWPMMIRGTLAAAFGIPQENVRVLSPYLGGGFGAGLRAWPHVTLTALAARVVKRPVKLVLTRPQMFNSVGGRPETTQRVRLGVARDGRLTAIDHDAVSTRAIAQANVEPIVLGSPSFYSCPNVATHERQVLLNIPGPGSMRGPGSAQAHFAIESALDELSYRVGVDPIEVRLRNYAEVHPQTGLPWSSKALRECYRAGADRFGWAKRRPDVKSMRDGHWLVGYGMAGVTYEWYSTRCQARISFGRDGRARVRSAGTDIGTGTYTVMTQVAAELLGLDISQVEVALGDSDLPPAPQSGGSGLAISLTGAIESAARNLRRAFLDLVAGDVQSPLRGRAPDAVAATGGRLHLAGAPSIGESYVDILARHEREELSADGQVTPDPRSAGVAPSPAFGAHFVEVHVDEQLGVVRVARLVSAVDGGRILNEKLARSQIMGGAIMGIGMALFEETIFDADSGRVANGTFGDYLIPVNADVPELEVIFVGAPDRFNAGGIKGIGEIGLVGVAAAIANAVYHATGRRIRSLPITIDKLM
jgi:xanthine dehydrogenase YagR molybdenum-binding subunit